MRRSTLRGTDLIENGRYWDGKWECIFLKVNSEFKRI